MARRGGAQQLQSDIRTDEDLEKFLTRTGLLVLEVYSDWCGPCLAMVNILRKCKIELGGDNLHLATCCADTVTPFKRFYKKSEPVFIFAVNGRAVGIFYGADAPKLFHVISKELEKLLAGVVRANYAISELQPVEAEALRVKTVAIQTAARIEAEKQQKKRLDYLNHCTDLILENLPDIGVTVFGPQVSRDMFKKLSEPADHLKMQCKDRKYMEITKEDFATINYACKNPLSADVIEQLEGKELLICFWKIDESSGPIPHVLAAYAHELTKERVAPADDDHPQPYPIPPLIQPLKVKIQIEVQEGEVWVEEVSSEEERRKEAERKEAERKAAAEKRKSAANVQEAAAVVDDGEDGEEEEESEGEEVPAATAAAPAAPVMEFDIDLGLDDDVTGEEEMLEEEEEAPKPITRTKRIKIPPIWVANNRRTHAALIFVLFRSQTNTFLPPDPPPEPPHVIMAFEAYKRDDILNVVDTIRDEVPQYGFFTTDVPADTKLITNSSYKYDEIKEPQRSDRLILKVNKVQSYTMLSLVNFEPTYVSTNTTIGQQDSLKFFPEDYTVDEEIPEGALPPRRMRKKMPATATATGAAPKKAAAPEKPEKAEKAEKPTEAAPAEAAPAADGQAQPAEGTAEGGAAPGGEAVPEGEAGEAPTEGEAPTAPEGAAEAAASSATEGGAPPAPDGAATPAAEGAAPQAPEGTPPPAEEAAPPPAPEAAPEAPSAPAEHPPAAEPEPVPAAEPAPAE